MYIYTYKIDTDKNFKRRDYSIVVLTILFSQFSTFFSQNSHHPTTKHLSSIKLMEAASSINRRIHTIDLKHRSILKQQMNMDGRVTHESEDDERMGGCGGGVIDDDKRKRAAAGGGASGKKGSIGGGSSSIMKMCQAEKCTVDLGDAKAYHRRHKVCELHSKAQVVLVAGIRQRFCQQCSRFHELLEFDDSKRSCRRRLAGHNERRRKNPQDHPNSNSQTIDNKGSAPAAAPSLLSSSSPLLF